MGYQKDPRTSVIILNYNSACFVADSIQSVLDQTKPPDEIIFCDDASTDNSVDIVRSFPGITLLSQPKNVGPLQNAISGINRSTGDILLFLDSDDIWEHTKIEVSLQMFNTSNDVFLVSHSHVHVNRSNQPINVTDSTHLNILSIKHSSADLCKRSSLYKHSILYRKGGFWLGSAYSFKRSCIDIEAITTLLTSIPSSRYAYADLVIAPYLIYTNPALSVSFSDLPLLRYRRHLSNATPETSNPETKLKSLRRIRQTNQCTLSLFSLLHRTDPSLSRVVTRYRLLEIEYDYLEALYSQNRLHTLKLFVSLIPLFVSETTLLKESLRLFLSIVFGPYVLCKLQHSRNRHIFSA